MISYDNYIYEFNNINVNTVLGLYSLIAALEGYL